MKKNLLIVAGLILFTWLSAAANGITPTVKSKVTFTPNKGQILGTDGKPVTNVLAKSSVPGLDFYLTTTGVTYVLKQYEEIENNTPHLVYLNEKKYTIHYSRVDVKLDNAVINELSLQFNEEQAWKSNYYLSANAKGQTGVKSYSSLTIKNVYPHIDWVWKSTIDGKLEYDFIVHPGGDASQIKMLYKYADITPSANSILISTHNGNLREGDLKANCNNAPVDVAYLFDNDKKEISFSTGAYDASKDLVIDPPLALQWSAQYGGTFADGLRGVANDNSYSASQPFVLLTGYTNSTNFPLINAGNGAYFDSTYNGNTDAVLMKLDTNRVPLCITYFGGSGSDFGNSVTVSNTGKVFVTGSAQNGLPLLSKPGAYNKATAVAQDAFVARFTDTLVLEWSTFYGGIGNEEGLKVHTDLNNQLYVAGYTNSPGNTLYTLQQDSGYYQNFTIGTEAFILKFDTGGKALWATLYGAAGDDVATSVATDSIGNVVVSGFTTSTNLVVTMDTAMPFYHQIANAGGTDGFLLRFDTLSFLKRATYYGGSGNDYFNDVTSGLFGDYVFTGRTSSPDFPYQQLNAQSYQQPALAGSYDAFIVKCRNDLNRKWATYFGGSGLDVGTGVVTDEDGTLYMTGFTFSADLPLDSAVFVNSYYQDTLMGQCDGFVSGFENYGEMFWSTYKGDSCYDYPADISYGSKCNMIFVCGEGLYSCNGSFMDTSFLNGGSAQDGFCWAFGGNGSGAIGGMGGGGSSNSCFLLSTQVIKDACPGQCNGQALAHIYDEIGPLSIVWSSGVGGEIGTALCFDTTWVLVQDENGCEKMMYVSFDSMTISMSAAEITCPSGGSVGASAGGGTSPFIYKWAGVLDPIPTLAPLHNPGSYYVTVTDDNGCTITGDTSITAINYPATVDIQILHNPSCGMQDGILVAVSMLTGNPVSVTWNFLGGPITTDTLTGIGIGGYGINNYSCENGILYPVGTELHDTVDMASAIYVLADDSSCVTNTGQIIVFIDSANYGANAPYTFLWSTGHTTAQVNNLYGDSLYAVTVTDAFGCTVVKSEVITDIASPRVFWDTADIVKASCAFTNDASYSAPVVTGPGAPFTYLWAFQLVPAIIEGHSWDTIPVTATTAGVYSVMVTGTTGCSDSASIYVGYEGDEYATFGLDWITCEGGSDGGLYLYPDNYSGSWSYADSILWSTGDTSYHITGLSAGIYQVTITWANGSVGEVCAQIWDGQEVPDSIVAEPYDCVNGGLPLSIEGMQFGSQMLYQWSTGETTPEIFAHGTADISVTVTTGNGCIDTGYYHVETAEPLAVSYTIDSITCFGTLATVDITATGGFSPYSNIGISYLPAGNYFIAVTDSIGCEVPIQLDLIGPTQPLQADIVTTVPVICNGGVAIIDVVPSGGVLPYTGGGTMQLSGGTYPVSIIDAAGCQLDTAVFVFEPDVLEVQYTAGQIVCDSTWIEITATGGVEPYTGTGTVYETAGTYSFNVIDSLGCVVTLPVTLTGPAPFGLSYIVEPILCYGGDATITVTATGGTMPYTGTGVLTYAADSVEVVVTDNAGCFKSETIIITQPDSLDVDVEFTPIACNGGSSIVDVVAGGGTAPYTGAGTFSNTAGGYVVSVTDANGCPKAIGYTITEPAELEIEVTVPDTINCNSSSAEVIVTASGGVSPYTGTGSFTYTLDGVYDFDVTDANGCAVSASASVDVAATTTEIVSTDDTICVNGAVMLTATGNFDFTWYPYDFNSSGISIAHVPVTTTVSVQGVSPEGCIATDTFTIVVESCDTTGIDELNGITINVFPNPANDRFDVQLSSGFNAQAELNLYAADGKLVAQQIVQAGMINTEVDCARFASGVYMLRITNGEKYYYRKLVINR